VKADLGLSDTEMSVVSGTAFVIFNLVVGLFIARWVDRGNRKLILLLGVAVWSAATALTALAEGFASLAATRIFVGVGEATPRDLGQLADRDTTGEAVARGALVGLRDLHVSAELLAFVQVVRAALVRQHRRELGMDRGAVQALGIVLEHQFPVRLHVVRNTMSDLERR